MLKTRTLRGLAALCFVALGLQTSFAQIIWEEHFSDESASLANWSSGGTNDGLLLWDWTNDVNAGDYQPGPFNAPTAATGYMWFDSYGNGPNAHDVTLTYAGTPASTTGYNDVHLRFYAYFRTFTGTDTGEVGISTDGVNFTYHNISQFDDLPQEASGNVPASRYQGWIDVDIPEADNKPAVWIQFRYIGNYEYYWKIDDVQLRQGSATKNVTFRVNMTGQTVSPSGVFVVGSFTGLAGVALTNMGNNIWGATVAVNEGETFTYRFRNGTTTLENSADLAGCGVPAPGGGFDRVEVANTDKVLPAVCFGSCNPCVLPCALNPNAIICDDFESYTVGAVSPQAPWWTPWTGGDASPLSAEVSTEQHSNGTKALKVVKDGDGDDQLLLLGDKASGHFELKWKMFIPTGHAGYFNIQNTEVTGTWNGDFYFDSTGFGRIAETVNNQNVFVRDFSYPHDVWFPVRIDFDLDNNLAKAFFDGKLVWAWTYPGKIGSIDFYAATAWDLSYIDEVEYVQLDPVVYDEDLCASATDLTLYLPQAAGVPSLTGLFDNTNSTVSPTDPGSAELDCFGDIPAASLDASQWYSFTGNGYKYHIETVPCNATNYIGGVDDKGDTQMLLYEGPDCSHLTPLACSEDLLGPNGIDYRAGVDVQTTSGDEYFILVDGLNLLGTVAKGEYCIEITRLPDVLCADAVVGDVAVTNDGFICWNGNVSDVITTDIASFVLPNNGPVYGMAWALTTSPVPANTTPTALGVGTGFLIQTTVTPFVSTFTLPNNGSFFPAAALPASFYVTPILLAGGVDTVTTNTTTFFLEVSLASACLFTGPSQLVTFLPPLDPLNAVANFTPETFPPGNNGSIELAVEGGFPGLPTISDPTLYEFDWSNGAHTQNLDNISGGTYTVTIKDPSNCVQPFQLTVNVTTGTDDPANLQSLDISPNPTRQEALVRLSLAKAAEVRLELVNALGQTVQAFDAGRLSTLAHALDLGDLSGGIYFLRVQMDGEVAMRRLALQR